MLSSNDKKECKEATNKIIQIAQTLETSFIKFTISSYTQLGTSMTCTGPAICSGPAMTCTGPATVSGDTVYLVFYQILMFHWMGFVCSLVEQTTVKTTLNPQNKQNPNHTAHVKLELYFCLKQHFLRYF